MQPTLIQQLRQYSRTLRALPYPCNIPEELLDDIEVVIEKANKVDLLVQQLAELQAQLASSNRQIRELQTKVEALEQAAVDKDSKTAQQKAIAAKMQQVLQQRQQLQQPQEVVVKEEAMAQGAPVTRVMTTRTTLEEASHDYEGLGDYVL